MSPHHDETSRGGGTGPEGFLKPFLSQTHSGKRKFLLLIRKPTGAGSLGTSAKVCVALFVKMGFIMMLTQKEKLNIKRLMKGFSHDCSAMINQRPEKWLVYN